MFCFLVLVSLVFLCCLAVWFLTFCLLPGFLSALPSGYCSPITDHACLPEYSSALPSIYLFASCSTLPVFLTMPLNKSLHADPHASRLVSPVTDPGESAPPERPRDSVLPEHSLGSAPPERPQASAPPEHPPRLWISPRNVFGPPSPRIYHGRLNSLPRSLRPYMLSLSLVSVSPRSQSSAMGLCLPWRAPAPSAPHWWASAPPRRSSAPSALPWWAPVSSVPPWWAPVSSTPPWWAPVSSTPPWWAPFSSAQPWGAPVPYVPPWWAPVSSAPPWWAPVSSTPPWWAPVSSAPPWYSALLALPRSLSLPHGPGPPSLPQFHLRFTALLDCLVFGTSGRRSLGGGGGSVMNPVCDLTPTHHQRSLAHYIDSHTTHTVKYYPVLHFP